MFAKIKLSPSHWSLLGSICVHAVILWFFIRVPIYQLHSPFPIKVRLTQTFTADSGINPPETATKRIDATSTGGASRKMEASRRQSAGSSEQNSVSGDPEAGAHGASSGLGDIVTDPGGIAVGGGPSTDSAPGSLGKGTPSGAGSGGAPSSQLKSAPKGASNEPPTVITIPESVRRSASPFGEELYVEVDMYTLYNSNIEVGIKIPGNEICLEGDQLRTIRPVTFQQTKTDLSKCRSRTRGDNERWICPSEAHTVISATMFLSSPVAFNINRCLLYDTSSCRWRERADESIEICRAKPDYQGIWAPGTQFHYPCAKSEIQLFTHSLEYGVRFMQDIEIRERHPKRKVVHRETRAIRACTENVLKSYPATERRTRFVFLSEWVLKRPTS
jgi:hypothetical protein